ncbi:hypothetical protein VTJ04DRAFT_1012 [Mycothermus thermophilus]|uniref:uncharacterized protein n=1 Tax=Humicola insolens TaxID=85995 RepID=UPI003743D689
MTYISFCCKDGFFFFRFFYSFFPGFYCVKHQRRCGQIPELNHGFVFLFCFLTISLSLSLSNGGTSGIQEEQERMLCITVSCSLGEA